MCCGNQGRLFEAQIYGRLQRLSGVEVIYDEEELRRMFGWQSVGVDFLVVFSQGVVAIQAKYRKTRRREDHGIKNFVKSLEHVLQLSGKRLCLGLWVSRMRPFDDNVLYLSRHNILCIHHFDCMSTLVERAIECVSKFESIPER